MTLASDFYDRAFPYAERRAFRLAEEADGAFYLYTDADGL